MEVVMAFVLPIYTHPDFEQPLFARTPPVDFKQTAKAGIAPENYHTTSIYPEYYQIKKEAGFFSSSPEWTLSLPFRMMKPSRSGNSAI